MHERIARMPGSRSPLDGRTTGITGLVYRSIRGINRVVGGSVDALLGVMVPMLLPTETRKEIDEPSVHAGREAIIAALNGVLGDYLAASRNPLAIPMQFRTGRRSLVHERSIVVLIHGLCMNDLQWQRDGHDHGARLAAELGFTPVYLHYNTGRHVSTNGRELAEQLQVLLSAWPRPVKRVVLLGHSMGGLVARSALYYGRLAGNEWVTKAKDVVCLGTPHHGAPLERIGRWIEVVLGEAPYAAPLAGLARLRSAGITDLRHGLIRDEDWRDGRDRHPTPLPRGVRCYALAGSTGKEQADLKGRLLGDGLVPVSSALGQHKDQALRLDFRPQRQSIQWRTNHMQLLTSPAVLATLREWLELP